MTDWHNDPYAGFGAYSYYPAGGAHLDADAHLIANGVPARHLYFAGEAAAIDSNRTGTVSGAFRSGDAVARRILEAAGVRKESSLKER